MALPIFLHPSQKLGFPRPPSPARRCPLRPVLNSQWNSQWKFYGSEFCVTSSDLIMSRPIRPTRKKRPNPIRWMYGPGSGQNFRPAIKVGPGTGQNLLTRNPKKLDPTQLNPKIIHEKSDFTRPDPTTCKIGLGLKNLVDGRVGSGMGWRKKPMGRTWPDLTWRMIRSTHH